MNKSKCVRLLMLIFALTLTGCTALDVLLEENVSNQDSYTEEPIYNEESQQDVKEIEEDEFYFTPEDVALYLYTFDELPLNYLTKEEARELGWVASEGNLWDVADGMVIGGDYFGNREGLLPEEQGRDYYEADVNYFGGFRGAERLVYSDDGLIYYTDDHYDSFTLLYGEE
ncbi:ribonuclease domain-containing protein [Alkalibacterium sp. MB6]|uniref:ribonuclease domain-containing protein n=1 Tax=Alkalibacterium sp. MB6 TaxID=2081965 RepID=UPI00137B8729|nr:ribonuclease domain-containing protein [Alkalibacterium sp. MB6]